MAKALHFKHGDLPFVVARTPGGNTRIARVVNADVSRHIGAGLEIVERVSIEWTVTYDEVLFIHEGQLTIESGGERFRCGPGDVVWLPEGTTLTYDARDGRCAYFYALYPVDWAARQGTREP
jgi:ethanolamine utilization protein EutQ